MTKTTLSAREAEIASAFANGASYRAIAADLGIAPTTVRTHLGTVYRKLGVSSKIQLLQQLTHSSMVVAPKAPASTSVHGGSRPTIVVLPFENTSGDADHNPLIGGLVEGLSAHLSRFRFFLLISPDTSLAYRDSGDDANMIAEEMSVRYVVRGAFNRSGDRLRVTADLIDAASRTHIWSRNFDGIWSDVFVLQDELASAIATAIEPEIRISELDLARRQPTQAMTAWTLYCRALHAAYTFTAEGYDEAAQLCKEAILLDGEFSAPYALLSRVHFMQVMLGFSANPPVSLQEGVDQARKALLIDDREDSAYACLSCNLVMLGAFQEAFLVLERGLAMNPNNVESLNARAFANIFAPDGDFQQVIADSEYALELSPNNPMRWTFLTNIGLAHLADTENGSLQDASRAFLQASMEPKASWIPFSGGAMAALAAGDADSCAALIARAKERQPGLSHMDHVQAFKPLMARSPRFRQMVNDLDAVLAHG